MTFPLLLLFTEHAFSFSANPCFTFVVTQIVIWTFPSIVFLMLATEQLHLSTWVLSASFKATSFVDADREETVSCLLFPFKLSQLVQGFKPAAFWSFFNNHLTARTAPLMLMPIPSTNFKGQPILSLVPIHYFRWKL